MISLRKPSDELIRQRLTAQADCDFTYANCRITNEGPASAIPHRYVVDHTRVQLGCGKATYDTAAHAIRNWQQFALGWIQATPTDTPIKTGASIAVVAWALGLWTLNVARIVYTIDDQANEIRRFGFAYGTLPDHVECGEERFLIEWDSRTDDVAYDILAYSRPRHPLTKLGYPLVRRMQKRFGRESAAAMQRLTRQSQTLAV